MILSDSNEDSLPSGKQRILNPTHSPEFKRLKLRHHARAPPGRARRLRQPFLHLNQLVGEPGPV